MLWGRNFSFTLQALHTSFCSQFERGCEFYPDIFSLNDGVRVRTKTEKRTEISWCDDDDGRAAAPHKCDEERKNYTEGKSICPVLTNSHRTHPFDVVPMLLPSKNSLFHRPCVLLYTLFFLLFFSGRWALPMWNREGAKMFSFNFIFHSTYIFFCAQHTRMMLSKKKQPKIMMLCRWERASLGPRVDFSWDRRLGKRSCVVSKVPCRVAVPSYIFLLFWLQVTPLWVIESESFFTRFSIFFFLLLVLFWYILNSRCAVWLLLLCHRAEVWAQLLVLCFERMGKWANQLNIVERREKQKQT